MQKEELNDLLTKAKELLKNEVTRISYETWIRDLEIESAEDGKIVLVANTSFQRDSIISRYHDLFKNTFNYLTNSLNSQNSSLSESINSYTQYDYVFDTNFFTQELETFSCLAFISTGTKIIPPMKLKLTPYFKQD